MMLLSTPMPTTTAAVIDALNSLLEAEQNSIFRFMGEGSPYLTRADASIRRALNEMLLAGRRRVIELAAAIERFGGIPQPGAIQREEQYLAFLSLKFLLPKLADAKRLTIERYENALRAIQGAPDEVNSLLNVHLAEHRRDLRILENARP